MSRRVLIVGNGLSVAAHGGYRLEQLTPAIRGRLDAVVIGDASARTHLDEIAHRMEADGQQDAQGHNFERLLGPLDRLGGLLGVELARVVGAIAPQLAQPLHEVAGLVSDLHIRGVGAVLNQIDALATHADLNPVRAIVAWAVSNLQDHDVLSVYTLNYDPLLDRALLELKTKIVHGVEQLQYNLADEFSGVGADAGTMSIVPGQPPIPVHVLRSEPYGRQRAVNLVHLHGGQHWLRTPGGLLYKAGSLHALRDADAYGRWMRGEPMHVQPLVLLTDQKTTAVARSPFREGYGRLRHDLAAADRVAIVGYGFGDLPINTVLAEAVTGPRPPGHRWIISRRAPPGDDGTETMVDIAGALGVDIGHLPQLDLSALPAIATVQPDFFLP